MSRILEQVTKERDKLMAADPAGNAVAIRSLEGLIKRFSEEAPAPIPQPVYKKNEQLRMI
ncbi:MAG: hypothetical protein WC454_08085 [Phycisphaerae bacterium]|jgi:hypothetical protein